MVVLSLTDCRGFKGLKQAIKLEFKLARYDQVPTNRDPQLQLLTKTGDGALPRTSHLRQVCGDTELLGKVYQQHARFY